MTYIQRIELLWTSVRRRMWESVLRKQIIWGWLDFHGASERLEFTPMTRSPVCVWPLTWEWDLSSDLNVKRFTKNRFLTFTRSVTSSWGCVKHRTPQLRCPCWHGDVDITMASAGDIFSDLYNSFNSPMLCSHFPRPWLSLCCYTLPSQTLALACLSVSSNPFIEQLWLIVLTYFWHFAVFFTLVVLALTLVSFTPMPLHLWHSPRLSPCRLCLEFPNIVFIHSFVLFFLLSLVYTC